MITKKDIGRRVFVAVQYDCGDSGYESGVIVDVLDDDQGGDLWDGWVVVVFDGCPPVSHSCLGPGGSKKGFCTPADTIIFVAAPEEVAPPSVNTAYASLDSVLSDAMTQASKTKGVERHANNNNYEDQVICVVQRLLKDHPFGGHAYQAIKKTIEAGRLLKIKGPEAAYQETLGAINYLSAMGILIKEEK